MFYFLKLTPEPFPSWFGERSTPFVFYPLAPPIVSREEQIQLEKNTRKRERERERRRVGWRKLQVNLNWKSLRGNWILNEVLQGLVLEFDFFLFSSFQARRLCLQRVGLVIWIGKPFLDPHGQDWASKGVSELLWNVGSCTAAIMKQFKKYSSIESQRRENFQLQGKVWQPLTYWELIPNVIWNNPWFEKHSWHFTEANLNTKGVGLRSPLGWSSMGFLE